jgi:predicted Zn-dependent protease
MMSVILVREAFQLRGRGASNRRILVAVTARLMFLGVLPGMDSGQRTTLKPGWNMFSPEQDVEIGRSVAADAERQLPMLKDARVDVYLNRIGRRLAEKAQGEKFPYQFKVVNDKAINAFALPGGFLYVNRGLIEVADNEAQLGLPPF